MENRKWKIESREEKADWGVVDARASWGAAVLRPYKERRRGDDGQFTTTRRSATTNGALSNSRRLLS
jgi:hypothetical protein